MSFDSLRRLACPGCQAPSDLLVLFDHLGDAWQGEAWIEVRCPACDRGAVLEIEGEDVAIGFVKEAPRALFEPVERVRQPGLRLSAAPDGIVLGLLHRRWIVARQQGPRR